MVRFKDSKVFELEFLNFINHYVKDIAGKGPKQTEVRFAGDTIVYFLRGILTDREKTLIQSQEGQRIVLDARRVFLDMDREHRIGIFEEFLGCEILENYESWNLENDSTVAILVLKENIFLNS